VHAVLPFRSRESAKSRLGSALDAEERDVLVLGMLANTVDTLASSAFIRRVHIVAADTALLPALAAFAPSLQLVPEPRRGDLNEALRAGRRAAGAAGATAVLMLPGDLPLLTVEAIDLFIEAADATLAAASGGPIVVLAPADARNGTNGLLIAPSGTIDPHFGLNSFEAHLRAAAAVEASVQIVDDPRLGFDLDTPDDLERLGLARQLELQELGEQVAGRITFARAG